MPRKFQRYVPKGASRKSLKRVLSSFEKVPASEDTPVSEDTQANEDIPANSENALRNSEVAAQQKCMTVDKFTQCDDLSEGQSAAEVPVVMCDASCQTDCDTVTSISDELAEDVTPDEPEKLCEGNPDVKFHPLILKHKGVFTNIQGSSVVAYYDQRHSTIRHVKCLWRLPDGTTGSRCEVCKQYRNVIRSGLNRLLKQQEQRTESCEASSHTNYRYLSTPEKIEKMKNLHELVRSKEQQIQSLCKKVDDLIQEEGVEVDSAMHSDLLTIMKKHGPSSEDSGHSKFREIFWQQQLKAASLKNSRSMRWHPAVIRWCLYLHHHSSGCYSTLRNSGVLSLPSERTLKDYKHFAPAVIGFCTSTDLQLLDQVKQQKPCHLSKYVSIVIDEMYVKEGLVYDKNTGSLTGYADLGEINNLLMVAEQRFKDPVSNMQRPLAKCMLVIMVRGLFNSLKFPYAQFPAASTKGAQLFPLLHQCVFRLTRLGLTVVSVTCDGASDNRRMFSLHGSKKELVYKTVNIFCQGKPPIFFISDPSHLIKTIRNCFARGRLWCNGYAIDWKLVVELYHRNAGAAPSTPGLSLVPKLTYEHIKLTSFSKMRVDLAVQVLSDSVSKAIRLSGGDGFETSNFIAKMDKFFDCFNVSSYSAGKRSRKPFLQPYHSASDFRLTFLKELILYLDHWQKTVNDRKDCEPEDKKHMVLSSIMEQGIRMTVSSFLELIPYLFDIEGMSSFLSEKLSQDPLEKFFGVQRQRGKSNENPTVSQFLKNTQGIRVINSIWLKDITGNCRGCKRKGYDLESVDLNDLNAPLKKRHT